MPEWRLQHTREAYESYREFYVKNIPTPKASWVGQRDDDGMYGNIFDRAVLAYESAHPCGCDAGANWICEQHRNG